MDLLNKVMIAGNLTRDPEVRETGTGKAVANLTLALDPPGGGKREGGSGFGETIFVEVVLWERTAELAGEYLKKGSGVLIEGRLQMDSWEDRESGKTRSKLRVAGDRMKFLNLGGSRSEGDRNRTEARGQNRDRRDRDRDRNREQEPRENREPTRADR